MKPTETESAGDFIFNADTFKQKQQTPGNNLSGLLDIIKEPAIQQLIGTACRVINSKLDEAVQVKAAAQKLENEQEIQNRPIFGAGAKQP